MAIDNRVQQRTPPFWMGLLGGTVSTVSLVVANVLYQTSQRYGQYGGPYSYWAWLAPSLGLITLAILGTALMVVLADQRPGGSSRRWERFGVGLVIGTLTGAALGFVFTAFFFKAQTDSYLINRPECEPRTSYTTGSPSQSCHNRNSTRW